MKLLSLSIPPESDRIIGITIPDAEAFYVCDHDQVWKATLGETPTYELTELEPYPLAKSRADFLGLVFAGHQANSPLHRLGPNQIEYTFDPYEGTVDVKYRFGEECGTIEFPTFSGDWFAASFSVDGRYLILAEPYEISLYAIPSSDR